MGFFKLLVLLAYPNYWDSHTKQNPSHREQQSERHWMSFTIEYQMKGRKTRTFSTRQKGVMSSQSIERLFVRTKQVFFVSIYYFIIGTVIILIYFNLILKLALKTIDYKTSILLTRMIFSGKEIVFPTLLRHTCLFTYITYIDTLAVRYWICLSLLVSWSYQKLPLLFVSLMELQKKTLCSCRAECFLSRKISSTIFSGHHRKTSLKSLLFKSLICHPDP